jgi:hypothetical protein
MSWRRRRPPRRATGTPSLGSIPGQIYPYGLEVWRGGAKVLSVLWADNGSFEVDSFVRGSWEEEALVL